MVKSNMLATFMHIHVHYVYIYGNQIVGGGKTNKISILLHARVAQSSTPWTHVMFCYAMLC